ncbi:MAG: hypothetical protein FWH11_02505 [Micrococcales bacterium]|nr:hypothetical protein [Micrococcales bacterium]
MFPLLTLEEFFDGNVEAGCIWCNVVPDPDDPSSQVTLADIRALLTAVRDRSEVQDVRIAVTQVDSDDEWPFSDQIVLVTDRTADEVVAWFPEALRPDDTWPLEECYRYQDIGVPTDRMLVLWWD